MLRLVLKIIQWFLGEAEETHEERRDRQPEVSREPRQATRERGKPETRKKARPAVSTVRPDGDYARSDREAASQSRGAGSGEKLQLVVGLDFGTAFTKVVIGEDRAKYAVHFGHLAAPECNGHLLPSVLTVVGEDGHCELGRRSPGHVYSDLKMSLIEGRFDDSVKVRMTAFIALVLRHAREWLLREHGRIYGDYDIDWLVNVGVPTESYDDDPLKTAYREVVAAAHVLAMGTDDVTIERCRKYLSRVDSSDTVEVVPEFVAQMQGYVRSPRRQENLHVVFDVGGGTVDLTIFNVLYNEEGGRYPIFYRAVRSLGVEYLRSKAEPTGPEFGQRLRTTIGVGLRYVHQTKDPFSRSWKDGVPVFFTGGGTAVSVYRDAIAHFERFDAPLRLKRAALPIPDDLQPKQLSGHCYGRLAVAYGLSLDPDDFGEIIAWSDTEDVLPPRPPDFTDWFVDKDQV